MKKSEDLSKVLNSYVYIIENYSKTKRLNIESKLIAKDDEASNTSENKSILSANKQQTAIESLNLIKLNT